MKYSGIPDLEHLEEWTELGIPFEYDDFMYPGMLDQKEETERRIREYLQAERDRSQDTLHGPFLDIAVHSSDRMIRRTSDYRIRQACEIALRLQVRGIILHTNIIPNFYEPNYRQGWIDRNEEYLTALLEDYPDFSVYMENMFDEEPDCLVALAERMQGKRFGICLDLAHANISRSGIAAWEKACAPYIAHYHINDNDGKVDSHLAVGEGEIDWERVRPQMKKDISILLEVSSLEKYKKSLVYLRRENCE
ncbi:MAG: sugar phosphate isomerase/epimerase [Clostridiales bacterium]|nr:sugar phosphate isomerase/epimerase [Clostridiales bacterium]